MFVVTKAEERDRGVGRQVLVRSPQRDQFSQGTSCTRRGTFSSEIKLRGRETDIILPTASFVCRGDYILSRYFIRPKAI